MLVKFRLPLQIKIATKTKPIDTSYETIWAADRKAPKKAYLELDDQPAIIIP